MSITIKGDDELIAAMGKIADGLTELSDGPTQAAQAVADRARALAPKLTGRLAKSIRGEAANGVAMVGTNISYGVPVHYGVPAHNQRPQPFLFQAVDAEAKDILDAWTKDVQALIDKSV